MSTWDGSAWQAAHFHYHGDRDLLVDRCIRPLSRDLLGDGLIRRFFYLYYALGGPHVRLRWLPTDDPHGSEDDDPVIERIRHHADAFFARSPSTESLDPQTVLQRNRSIAAAEAEDDETELVPDNSWVRRPPHFEVRRYGGPELLPASLDLFTLSSLVAFEHLRRLRDADSNARVTAIWRTLASQVLASAESLEDLDPLLDYSVTAWGDAVAPFVERADQAFERQPDAYRSLLAKTAFEVTEGRSAAQRLDDGVRLLRRRIHRLPPRHRWRVFTSHLHMTANRLGAGNREETYVCRLVARAVASIADRGGLELEALHAALARKTPEEDLADLTERALAEFAGS